MNELEEVQVGSEVLLPERSQVGNATMISIATRIPWLCWCEPHKHYPHHHPEHTHRHRDRLAHERIPKHQADHRLLYSSPMIRFPLLPYLSSLLVVCCTFSIIQMTTTPPRSIIPKIGGLSFAAPPQPRVRRHPQSPLPLAATLLRFPVCPAMT